MHRLLALPLVLCASIAACEDDQSAPGVSNQSDGGGTEAGAAPPSADAIAPMPDAQDGQDAASDATDASVEDAVQSCRAYSKAPTSASDEFYYQSHDELCDVSCGAAGPYLYSTPSVDIRPSLAVCNQLTNEDGSPSFGFCCTTLTCVRDKRGPYDTGCANKLPAKPYAFFCGGPKGKEPARANCETYDGAPKGTVCCATE